MHLGFALYRYFPFGGLQRDFAQLVRTALAQDHRVTAWVMRWEGPAIPGLKVQVIPTPWVCRRHVRYQWFARTVVAQASVCDTWMALNKIPGAPVYYAADGCLAERWAHAPLWKRSLPRTRSLWAQEREAVQRARCVMVLCPKAQAAYQAAYGLPESRCVLLPPGIDPSRVAPADRGPFRKALRARWGLEDTARVLIMVGSGFATKGLDRALRLMARLRHHPVDTHLVVVGEGRLSGVHRALWWRYGLGQRVHCVGGADDVPAMLWGSDLLLHPAYHENTGTVLLEALVAGVPVVTTEVCGYAHWVSQSGGGTVLGACPSEDDWYQAVCAYWEHPERITQWQAQAPAFARQSDLYSLHQQAVAHMLAWGQRGGA